MTVIILLSEYIFIVSFMLAVHLIVFIVFTITLFYVLLASCSGHTFKRDFFHLNLAFQVKQNKSHTACIINIDTDSKGPLTLNASTGFTLTSPQLFS